MLACDVTGLKDLRSYIIAINRLHEPVYRFAISSATGPPVIRFKSSQRSPTCKSSVTARLLVAIKTLSPWHIYLEPISAHDLVEAYFMDLKIWLPSLQVEGCNLRVSQLDKSVLFVTASQKLSYII